MNKKNIVIVSGTVAALFTLSACGGDKYEYEAKGKVVANQIEWEDCDMEQLSMDLVSFSSKTGGTSGGGGKGNSNSGSSKSNSTSGGSTSGDSTSGGSGGNVNVKKNENKGVKLSEKPSKPEKLKKLPKLNVTSKGKGCEAEYELFVQEPDGDLWEQDVRKADYEKCIAQFKQLFPACTRN